MIELDERIPTQGQGLFSLPHRTSTSHTIPVCTHMALGKLSNDGTSLNLVPLSHIVQMRPSFEHVNADPDVSSLEEETLEKKPVLFQKKETERAALARKSSFAYKKSSEESEPWQMLLVCGPDTIQHGQAGDKVICPSPSTPLCTSSTMNNASFVQSLNYLPVETTVEDTTTTTTLEIKNVCAQLTTLLQRGWPVPYSVLKDKFLSQQQQQQQQDDDLLLLFPSLLSTCVLVRGNFILQSRFLPLEGPLQNVRSFILLLLQTLGRVERVRLECVFPNIPPEAIQMLLEQVAIKRDYYGQWQPKLQDHTEFFLQFPQQTLLYDQYWERQTIRFSNQLELYKNAV
jgi:DNA-directed RNA polymerase-3 subunit RPC5